MPKPKRNYVDNKKFYEAILLYKKNVRKAKREGKEEPRIPDYVGECILKIAENLSTKPCFASYTFREEMVSDGIENCILYFKDYDPKIGQNPFAYFTQIIYYAFLRRISKEEKNRYIIYKNFQHTIIHGNNNDDIDIFQNSARITPSNSETAELLPTMTMYDNINDFMYRFEKKEEVKKNKRKKMKRNLQKYYEDV